MIKSLIAILLCLLIFFLLLLLFILTFILKYHSNINSLTFKEILSKFLSTPTSDSIKSLIEIFLSDEKTTPTPKEVLMNITKIIPIGLASMVTALSYQYVYEMIKKINIYSLQYKEGFDSFASFITFFINVNAIFSLITTLILLLNFIREKKSLLASFFFFTNILIIGLCMLYGVIVNKSPVHSTLLLLTSYNITVSFFYMLISQTFYILEELYKWIIPHRNNSKIDHKTTIAKLSFLWTILAFILGLLFNFKK